MKLGLLLLAWGISAGAVEYQRQKCDDHFGNVTWHHLTLNEPALNEAFKLIVEHSGSTKVTNCAIDFPVKDGQPTTGPRRVIMDAQWYVTQYIDGVAKKLFRHEGIMVEYDLSPGQMGTLREVLGYSVCRTPAMCSKLGIPFPSSTKLPQTY